MRVTFVTSGLEHLGIEALSAYVSAHGHESTLVYEPKPFSSNSGPDSALFARLLEPTPEHTAERIAASRPDVIAFSSYTITHRWSVDVARTLKRIAPTPIVFGGPHVSGAPAHSIEEAAIDAVVEGEGEGALLDLLACAEKDRFGRTDVANVWFKGDGGPTKNPVRPLISDLDTLPWADKAIFYDPMPAFEREFYVISRRGCPFRCSFCEYSIFPKQYPGERPVRRRSVEHVIGELAHWKARGRVRKVFFWDAIFTLDVGWMREFAAAYRREVGLPFECYTHPHAMSPDMASALAEAGCSMVRVGVQTVNADTLAEMDRKGNRERVRSTVEHLRDFGINYSLDHILGLPGEGPEDQREALRFYNDVRPARILVHWMTYLPGTTALDRAHADGILSPAQVERILRGQQTEGFEAPRLVGPGAHKEALDEIRHLEVLFDLLPLLPRRAIDWLLESGAYRLLPRGMGMRQVLALALALFGNTATRERIFTILGVAARGAADAARLRVSGRARPGVEPLNGSASIAPALPTPARPVGSAADGHAMGNGNGNGHSATRFYDDRPPHGPSLVDAFAGATGFRRSRALRCEEGNADSILQRISRGQQHAPTLLRGLVADWPAVQRWDREYMLSGWGDACVSAAVGLPPHGVPFHLPEAALRRIVTLRGFWDELDASPCWLDEHSFSSFPGLENDLRIPDVVDATAEQELHLWIGRGTRSGLHYDPQDHLLFMIRGHKFVAMAPSHEAGRLYPFPGSIMKSRVDVEHPDLARFPRAADVEMHVGRIAPGDALYIPAGWWHYMSSPEDEHHISVTCSFGRELPLSFLASRVVSLGPRHAARIAGDFVRYGLLGRLCVAQFHTLPNGLQLYRKLRARGDTKWRAGGSSQAVDRSDPDPGA